ATSAVSVWPDGRISSLKIAPEMSRWGRQKKIPSEVVARAMEIPGPSGSLKQVKRQAGHDGMTYSFTNWRATNYPNGVDIESNGTDGVQPPPALTSTKYPR